MSANLTCFQTSIIAPIEALDWLEKKLSGEFDENNPEWAGALCNFERSSDDPTKMHVWTEHPEDCDDDPLVNAVLDMQKKFDLADPWFLEQSFHDSASFAEFHAGVAICYKGKYWFLRADNCAEEFFEKMLKGELESVRPEDQKMAAREKEES